MTTKVKENQCPNCFKMLSNKYKLIAHLNKKNPCQEKKEKKEFKCEKCRKVFSMKHHLQAHMNRKIKCTPIISDEVMIEKEKTKQSENRVKEEKEKTKQEELRLKIVEKELSYKMAEDIKNPNLLIETLNINIQNNIVVNVDETSTIPSIEEIGTALNYDDPQDAKKYILKSIFNNPERPQNQSVIYLNKKKDDLLLFQNNEWKLKRLSDEYGKIFNIARKLFTKGFEKLSNDIIKELLEIPEEQFRPELFDGKYADYKDYYDKKRSDNIYGLIIDFEYVVECLLIKACNIRKYY